MAEERRRRFLFSTIVVGLYLLIGVYGAEKNAMGERLSATNADNPTSDDRMFNMRKNISRTLPAVQGDVANPSATNKPQVVTYEFEENMIMKPDAYFETEGDQDELKAENGGYLGPYDPNKINTPNLNELQKTSDEVIIHPTEPIEAPGAVISEGKPCWTNGVCTCQRFEYCCNDNMACCSYLTINKQKFEEELSFKFAILTIGGMFTVLVAVACRPRKKRDEDRDTASRGSQGLCL